MVADITNAAQAAGNTLWKRRQTEYPNFITFVVATTIGDRLAEIEAALKDTKRLAERVSSEIGARNP